MTNVLPPPFEQQMQQLLGAEFAAFLSALREPAPVSIRENPAKKPAGSDPLCAAASPVPWHPQGWYLPERPVFTLDPLLHAGAYYVQEASSMFLQEALRQALAPDAPLKVLDLCAAPGGKSTLLLAALPGSLVVSNEVIRSRVSVLRENLERWGDPRTAVTSAEAEDFAPLADWFDVVVTDAPCSGEGLFRKDPDAVREWSPEQVLLCAARQKRILSGAVSALKPGGLLVYSTCTYNAAENEENAAWLCREFELDPVRLTLPAEWGIAEGRFGYQFFPHRLRGEGFFISLFRKKAGAARNPGASARFRSLQALPKKQIPELAPWFRSDATPAFFQTPAGEILAFPEALESDLRVLDKVLKNKWFGLYAGSFKGRDFIPGHALALSSWCSPTLPGVELSREQALRFLKKEIFDLPAGAPGKGWALARYRGLNLGWLKVVPGRWNNYLPAERRIRMEL
ncbi:MAG: RNA methyltransferase [Saprospiraceae bacterium]